VHPLEATYLGGGTGAHQPGQQLRRKDKQRPLVPEHLQHVHQRVTGVRSSGEGGRQAGVAADVEQYNQRHPVQERQRQGAPQSVPVQQYHEGRLKLIWYLGEAQ
jgi:hypothetical protein